MSIIELRGGILQELGKIEEERSLTALFQLLKRRNMGAAEIPHASDNLAELMRLFFQNAPKNIEISEEEIIAEMMAVRYGEAA